MLIFRTKTLGAREMEARQSESQHTAARGLWRGGRGLGFDPEHVRFDSRERRFERDSEIFDDTGARLASPFLNVFFDTLASRFLQLFGAHFSSFFWQVLWSGCAAFGLKRFHRSLATFSFLASVSYRGTDSTLSTPLKSEAKMTISGAFFTRNLMPVARFFFAFWHHLFSLFFFAFWLHLFRAFYCIFSVLFLCFRIIRSAAESSVFASECCWRKSNVRPSGWQPCRLPLSHAASGTPRSRPTVGPSRARCICAFGDGPLPPPAITVSRFPANFLPGPQSTAPAAELNPLVEGRPVMPQPITFCRFSGDCPLFFAVRGACRRTESAS